MPCYDDRTSPSGPYVPPQIVERIIKEPLPIPQETIGLEVLLCSACRVLARLGYDFDENPALSRWWDKHKKKDAASDLK